MARRAKTKVPMRRCVACRQSKPQSELMRFTLDGGRIEADCGTKAEGRGYYLCRDSACIELSIRKNAFNRACRRNLDAEEVRRAIAAAGGGLQ